MIRSGAESGDLVHAWSCRRLAEDGGCGVLTGQIQAMWSGRALLQGHSPWGSQGCLDIHCRRATSLQCCAVLSLRALRAGEADAELPCTLGGISDGQQKAEKVIVQEQRGRREMSFQHQCLWKLNYPPGKWKPFPTVNKGAAASLQPHPAWDGQQGGFSHLG